MADRILSQNEIDNVFRSVRDSDAEEDPAKKVVTYDFRRPVRIAKEQLQSIHLAHDNFARSVGSSVSAFLRRHVVATFISVEQLSFAEFVRSLPMPSCLMSLGVQPLEDNVLLQLERSLVFVILELLLGGTGKSGKISRDVTEIERGVLDSVLRIILNDLRLAWQTIASVEFSVQSYLSEPQFLQALPQDDAVVVVSMEIRVGETSGLMHLAFPSMLIRALRGKTSQGLISRKRESNPADHSRVMRLITGAHVEAEVRLAGPKLCLDSLLQLEPGHVLAFDHALTKEVDLVLNGQPKFLGHVVKTGNKLSFKISAPVEV
jgi:flagellar motor switch protein FliM